MIYNSLSFFFILIYQLLNFLVLRPYAEYLWNHYQTDVFLNSSQEERIFAKLQNFEEEMQFDMLISYTYPLNPQVLHKEMEEKAFELAHMSNNESINSIAHVFTDLLIAFLIFCLLINAKKEIAIIQTYIDQYIYSLTDAKKSFFLILFTDIFVGFHSSHGWKILIELCLTHLGLPENKGFIFLFVATFPVILDTLFKYWIFLYLNRISPSAVATFNNMNE
uniref:envelope membrane protein n=1 Tax=Mesostigma viride TaxID=41882 RepID=UPI0000F2ADDC|nr:envelope membrane protein [Mesostigma viride]